MSDPRASTLHARRCSAASRRSCSCLLSFGDARPAPAADASGSDPFETPESFDTPGDEADFFKVESDVVTSVSRHPESSWGAAAAITVVTGEEIEASGAQSLTDALRIVPGLDVASVDRNTNAVSARGLTTPSPTRCSCCSTDGRSTTPSSAARSGTNGISSFPTSTASR